MGSRDTVLSSVPSRLLVDCRARLSCHISGSGQVRGRWRESSAGHRVSAPAVASQRVHAAVGTGTFGRAWIGWIGWFGSVWFGSDRIKNGGFVSFRFVPIRFARRFHFDLIGSLILLRFIKAFRFEFRFWLDVSDSVWERIGHLRFFSTSSGGFTLIWVTVSFRSDSTFLGSFCFPLIRFVSFRLFLFRLCFDSIRFDSIRLGSIRLDSRFPGVWNRLTFFPLRLGRFRFDLPDKRCHISGKRFPLLFPYGTKRRVFFKLLWYAVFQQ